MQPSSENDTSHLLPRIKITELLMDVDDWTGFSRHFTHLKDGAEAKDRTLLLSSAWPSRSQWNCTFTRP
ncbi:hypothetical protein APB04_33255 [Pseudomonas aeruginosa]|nr:hypothetical protein APB04_33255 [Pseudomonas aeruginosa]